MIEDTRSKFINSLSYILGCNVLYMYFLDWNIFTLLIRGLQLFCAYRGSKPEESEISNRRNSQSVQRILFVFIVIISNLPVLLLHLTSRKIQPISLNFIGTNDETQLMASPYTLLLGDLFVMIIQSLLILHRSWLKEFKAMVDI